MSRLPDWLILGAPKAGTTTLAEWLRENPAAFVSQPKELSFFDDNWDRGIEWYRAQFDSAPADARVGEATPAYLYYDHALDRIQQTLPEARLAVILREPVSRAWSNMWYFRTLGAERRHPKAILRAELVDPTTPIEGVGFGYLWMGRYVDRLIEITDRFSRDQLLVLFTDELKRDASGTFARLCEHFGLPVVPPPEVRANPGGAPRSATVQRLAGRVGGMRPESRTVRRGVGAVMRANRRDGYPPVPPELKARARAAFAQDNDRLADWLGRQLPSGWSSARD